MLINLAAAATTSPNVVYTNHTVGDAAGWFFNSTNNKTSTDYSAWAAKQTFNLGDYLIFNTNTNSTLVQTYNQTTYKSCSIDDASDTDTFQYLGGNSEYGKALAVAVPLTIEGSQYFFSEADDGLQCQNGMAFQIKVGRGSGLPPSLNQPPPPPYVEPPSTVEEGQTPPITIVTSPPSSGMRHIVGLLHLVVLAILVLYCTYPSE